MTSPLNNKNVFVSASKLLPRHPCSLSYGVNLPSSLTTLLPLALEFSSYLPVSVCGTGALDIRKTFLALVHACFPTYISVPYARVYQRPGHALSECPFALIFQWLRNFYRMCIGYASRPHLSPRLTWSGRTFLQKP